MSYLDADQLREHCAKMLVERTPPKEADGPDGVSVTLDPDVPKRESAVARRAFEGTETPCS